MIKKLLTSSIVSLALFSCGDGTTKPYAKNVTTVTVENYSEEEYVSVPGKAKSVKDISLSFRVSGKILKSYVKEGQTVKEGQLLAELDPTDYQVQSQATEAKYTQIKREAERIMAMYEDGAIPENDYDKANYGLQQMEAMLTNHRNELSYTKLYAPCHGKIKNINVENGEIVGAGMPVISMIDNEKPLIEIYIPAKIYNCINEFEKISCIFSAIPDEEYNLNIVSIAPTANANQLYEIKLTISSSNTHYPTAGMNTIVRLYPTSSFETDFSIPTSAIVTCEETQSVYKLNKNDSTVSKIDVNVTKIGANGNIIVQSTELKPGDIIIEKGAKFLSDKDKVVPLPTISKSNKGGLL